MKKTKQAKSTQDRRSYKIYTTIAPLDPYADECVSIHRRRTKYSKKGSKNYFSWKRKELYRYQYRRYRTWKHHRKTQWKQNK